MPEISVAIQATNQLKTGEKKKKQRDTSNMMQIQSPNGIWSLSAETK